MNEQKSYFAVIPATVRYDSNLTANAKLLYGEITALSNEKGYCWANNEYFAQLYQVSKSSVTKWISSLVKSGYLKHEIFYKDDNKTIEKRILRITDPIVKISDTYSKNLRGGIVKIYDTPIVKIYEDNNTYMNNTLNNKKKSIKESLSEIENQELQELLADFVEMRKLKKKPLTNRAFNMAIKRLNELSPDLETQKKIIENSISHCWDSFYPLKGEKEVSYDMGAFNEKAERLPTYKRSE